MPTLYFLDAAEFAAIPAVASAQTGARTQQLAGYVAVSSDGSLVIDRRATGVRHAVWYRSAAAVSSGRVTQFDKDVLRVEPMAEQP